MPEWLKDVMLYAPTIGLTIVLGYFYTKHYYPHRVKVKLRRLDIEEKLRRLDIEEKLRRLDIEEKQATALEKSAAAMLRVADVLEEVAIDQRRAMSNLEILQRVAADTVDRLEASVQGLVERVEKLETRGSQ